MAQVEVYFVEPDALNEAAGRATLTGDEAHHLLRVRRAAPGDALILIDGRGTAWEAELAEIAGRDAVCQLRVRHETWREPVVDVHVGLALLKGDHLLDAVDSCTQAGMHELTPLVTARSIAGFKENKARRAERRALEAAKQCGRGRQPAVNPAQPLADWCISTSEATRRFVLDPAGTPLPRLRPGDSAAVAVGPEGGFTDDEVLELERCGFVRATLGPRRFRAEIAAFAAVTRLIGPTEDRSLA